jgi:hypothetical protein
MKMKLDKQNEKASSMKNISRPKHRIIGERRWVS